MRMRTNSGRTYRYIAIVGLVAEVLLQAAGALGQTLANWRGPNGGAWNTPGNWDIGQVPNNNGNTTYNVRFDAGSNSGTLNISPVLNNYTQASGSLVGDGSNPVMSVNNAFTWNSGLIDQLNVKSAGTATISKIVQSAMNPTLGNATLNLQGASQISASPLDGRTGATINNGGTLTISGASSFNDLSNGVTPLPSISNSGTINKTGNGTANVNWATTTTGTIEAMAGTLQFGGTQPLVENAGKVTVDQGATLTALNNILVNNATIGGAGTINGNVLLNNGTIIGHQRRANSWSSGI